MRIAFIHQNMPGQYRGLMPHYLSDPANEVVAVGEADNIRRNFLQVPEGLKLIGYQMPKLQPITGHPFLRPAEHFVYRGEMLARVLVDLKNKDFKPDVICSHPGWGESLYIKDVFPDARLINYCEFFYHAHGQDYNFDPEYPEPEFAEWGLRTRNAIQLLSLNSMDVGISPSRWQATRYPKEYQPKISIISEGVDTERVKPDPDAKIVLNNGAINLTAEDEIITFVNRNLEPYRGFHIFMRTLPELLAQRPRARVLIIGGDEVSYGKSLPPGMTYRQRMLEEVGAKIDLSRVHFLGKVPYADYLRVLQISTAHVYLTYPFVLSWSVLEAMAVGCVVIGSRTAPVEEVIEHDKNGILVDFFSQEQIIAAVNRACDNKAEMRGIRERARETIIQKFDAKTVCLPQHFKLIEGGKEIAPPVAAKVIPAVKPILKAADLPTPPKPKAAITPPPTPAATLPPKGVKANKNRKGR